MTLIGSILKKVQSHDSTRKYASPPPELATEKIKSKNEKPCFKYGHVGAKVDTSPPRYDVRQSKATLWAWARAHRHLYNENIALLLAIKRMHFTGGRVDCRWKDKELPAPSKMYIENRMNFYKNVNRENKDIYKRLCSTRCRVESAAEHRRSWARHRADILSQAQRQFVLFPRIPREDIEAAVFKPPPGVKRPRVFITLRIQDGAELGELQLELFAETCPETCRLFLELLDGDGLGHGYVGTHFFTKVPNLYWSGGDVIHNNGFGCYAQRGRSRGVPVGAENYHYSHCMPGLLSMRVTRDDEMCGMFHITFKPLLQFDLKNVVFGRVIRPSEVYNAIRGLGAPNPLARRPVVELCASRRKTRAGGGWVRGAPNTTLATLPTKRCQKTCRV